MYISPFTDHLLSENRKLKQKIALYESESTIAEMQHRCDQQVRGATEKADRNYDAWMNAVAVNKQLKKENSELRKQCMENEKRAKKKQRRCDYLEKENERVWKQFRRTEEERDRYKKDSGEKDHQIEALKEELCRLRAQLDHDGSTNGIPTSQTPMDKKKRVPNCREKTGRNRGGQEGHEKKSLKAFDGNEVTEQEDHGLENCPCCGGRLKETGKAKEKDETDYEVKIIRKRHRFHEYQCENCGKTVHAKIPKKLKEENQYGAGVQALALSLLDQGFVSVTRTRDILNGILNGEVTPSIGFVGSVQRKAAKQLKAFLEEVRKFCLRQSLLYWDDTVIFMNTKRACFRFYGNDTVAYYRAHESKGAEGIEADGILANLTKKTTLMHDHVKYNYRKEFLFRNIECVQHLERELESVFRASGHAWAGKTKKLIASTIHKRNQYLKKGLDAFTDEDTNRFEEKLEQMVVQGYRESEADQGRYFFNDERKALRKIEEYRANYFAWVYDFTLPTTNNLAESSLRMTKTKQKVSGQFWKKETAEEFAAVRTYTETCRRNGVDEFRALRRLMEGNPYTLEEILNPA